MNYRQFESLLSCHFPFVFNKQHHNECQVTGVNNELCLCGTDAKRPNIDEFYMEMQSQDFIFQLSVHSA